MNTPDVVISHSHCPDGFTSRWVVWTRFGFDSDMVFIDGKYGTEPPLELLDGKVVWICDFSYPRNQMEQIIAAAREVVVLDHHKTAQEDLADLEGATIVFDMERSGAGITWDYCFPGTDRHPLVTFVEDRDLWRFENHHTETIAPLVMAWPMTLGAWQGLAELVANRFGEALSSGQAIAMYRGKLIQEQFDHHRFVVIAGHQVPATPAPYSIASDVAGALAEHYPDAPFAAYYIDKGNGLRQWGLRSRNDDPDGGFDVSEVAKLFGGGGHRNAAGFVQDDTTHGPVMVEP